MKCSSSPSSSSSYISSSSSSSSSSCRGTSHYILNWQSYLACENKEAVPHFKESNKEKDMKNTQGRLKYLPLCFSEEVEKPKSTYWKDRGCWWMVEQCEPSIKALMWFFVGLYFFVVSIPIMIFLLHCFR